MLNIEPKNYEKCYIHNIFSTLSQYILSSRLLLVDTKKKKKKISDMFKLELVKTYYLGFDVLVLQKCCGCNTFKNCLNKKISLKVQIKYLIVIFKIVSDQDTKN